MTKFSLLFAAALAAAAFTVPAQAGERMHGLVPYSAPVGVPGPGIIRHPPPAPVFRGGFVTVEEYHRRVIVREHFRIEFGIRVYRDGRVERIY